MTPAPHIPTTCKRNCPFLFSLIFLSLCLISFTQKAQSEDPSQYTTTQPSTGQENSNEHDYEHNDLDDQESDQSDDQDFDDATDQDTSSSGAGYIKNVAQNTQRYIRNIYVLGNNQVATETILRRIPYRQGEIFHPRKSGQLIRNVYDVMGQGVFYFKSVKLEGKLIEHDAIDLYIIVEEKNRAEGFIFRGNKHLPEKEILKKFDYNQIPALDETDLGYYTTIIKKLYAEKDYHNVAINTSLEITEDRATAIFDIDEGPKAVVKHVKFVGNNTYSAKKLRSLLFTREEWILSFMDRAGSYQPDAIEGDRYLIENFYQSNGYMKAKVYDVATEVDPATQHITVTFYVEEGERYTISDIKVPGNEVVTDEYLLERLPIRVGDIYSRDQIRQTIEWLKLFWGEYGYINADIEPSVQPNDDDKTVALSFYSELGSKVYLNRITILGNKKTRDKVIRRNIALEEGDLITTKKMEDAKHRIENLGYFDTRGGVNWRIHTLSKDTADLDLIVRETKTGQLAGQLGFGGSPRDFTSPAASANFNVFFKETNLFGQGIHLDLGAEISKQNRNLNFNITDPWLFDRPFYGSFEAMIRQSIYEDIKQTEREVTENYATAVLSTGFTSNKLNYTRFSFQLGSDSLNHNPQPRPATSIVDPLEREEYSLILNRRFADGTFVWLGSQIMQDIRNHPIHPSQGHQFAALFKLGVPRENGMAQTLTTGRINGFGFAKLDVDASWYTPLIGERDLVFCLHGHFGYVSEIGNQKTIPFRELYHVGGPSTVRGYLYGDIGPTWRGDSLGGKKALWINAELIFPIMNDFSMKGAVFYDGGSGWDTPNANLINPIRLRNNSFNYRHAVGIGVRILQPTPIQIDWGFKLDRKKGEEASQVHLTMTHNF